MDAWSYIQHVHVLSTVSVCFLRLLFVVTHGRLVCTCTGTSTVKHRIGHLWSTHITDALLSEVCWHLVVVYWNYITARADVDSAGDLWEPEPVAWRWATLTGRWHDGCHASRTAGQRLSGRTTPSTRHRTPHVQNGNIRSAVTRKSNPVSRGCTSTCLHVVV